MPAHFEDFFEKRLDSLYESDMEAVDKENTEQEKILADVQRANKEFEAQKRSAGDKGNREREAALQRLDNAFYKYKEIVNNVEVGRKFYNDLSRIVGAVPRSGTDMGKREEAGRQELGRVSGSRPFTARASLSSRVLRANRIPENFLCHPSPRYRSPSNHSPRPRRLTRIPTRTSAPRRSSRQSDRQSTILQRRKFKAGPAMSRRSSPNRCHPLRRLQTWEACGTPRLVSNLRLAPAIV